MNIFNDDDTFVFGTARADHINCDGQALEILGGKGDDFINPGIRVDLAKIIMVFGGSNAHDTRDGADNFRFGEPRANSGDDRIAVGQGIWGDGEDGRDFYESHGPSSPGKFMPRVWMDIEKDRLSVDNSDHSHDRHGRDFRADGSGIDNGFELLDIHFERTFQSKAGYHYAEVNTFTVHSLSRSPLIREQFTGVATYPKGDDPKHDPLYVPYDPVEETARQAVAEWAHEHALPGPDQFLF